MADLRTKYMGIELKNPFVVGACSLSKQVDTIRQLEAAGAGALVIKSLFEEQIQLENAAWQEKLSEHDDLYAEAVNLFPKLPHAGPKEHLHWIAETRKAVELPLIASLNAVHDETWVEYARKLAETGVQGLELNFYSLPLDPAISGAEIEKRELDAFAKVRAAVKIPLAVKLHPYYTNVLQVATAFDRAGANAIILFNRLFQPDISIEAEAERGALTLTHKEIVTMNFQDWRRLVHPRFAAIHRSGLGELTI